MAMKLHRPFPSETFDPFGPILTGPTMPTNPTDPFDPSGPTGPFDPIGPTLPTNPGGTPPYNPFEDILRKTSTSNDVEESKSVGDTVAKADSGSDPWASAFSLELPQASFGPINSPMPGPTMPTEPGMPGEPTLPTNPGGTPPYNPLPESQAYTPIPGRAENEAPADGEMVADTGGDLESVASTSAPPPFGWVAGAFAVGYKGVGPLVDDLLGSNEGGNDNLSDDIADALYDNLGSPPDWMLDIF